MRNIHDHVLPEYKDGLEEVIRATEGYIAATLGDSGADKSFLVDIFDLYFEMICVGL